MATPNKSHAPGTVRVGVIMFLYVGGRKEFKYERLETYCSMHVLVVF